jgi:hypothetical protein
MVLDTSVQPLANSVGLTAVDRTASVGTRALHAASNALAQYPEELVWSSSNGLTCLPVAQWQTRPRPQENTTVFPGSRVEDCPRCTLIAPRCVNVLRLPFWSCLVAARTRSFLARVSLFFGNSRSSGSFCTQSNTALGSCTNLELG